MWHTTPDPQLARGTFELASRGFVRHAMSGPEVTRDPRHLRDLLEVCDSSLPFMAAADDEYAEFSLRCTHMKAELEAIQQARSVRNASPATLVHTTLQRSRRVFSFVLLPQHQATRRPALIQQVMQSVEDVLTFSRLEPDAFPTETRRSERLRGDLERMLVNTRKVRAALDATAFTDLLGDELRATIKVAKDTEEIAPRVMALDRVVELQRQLVLSAGPERALRMTHAALQMARRRGPYRTE